MPHETDKPARRSVRLKGFDYSQAGLYFVTVCTHDRQNLFGEIVRGKMVPTELGETVRECWLEIPRHFAGVQLDSFVVMPNHIHGVLVFFKKASNRTNVFQAFGKPVARSLAVVIAAFKAAVSRRWRRAGSIGAAPFWQRNYYEHVIRTGAGLLKIQKYILENPAQWKFDKENPNRRTIEDIPGVVSE